MTCLLLLARENQGSLRTSASIGSLAPSFASALESGAAAIVFAKGIAGLDPSLGLMIAGSEGSGRIEGVATRVRRGGIHSLAALDWRFL